MFIKGLTHEIIMLDLLKISSETMNQVIRVANLIVFYNVFYNLIKSHGLCWYSLKKLILLTLQ